MRSKSPSRPAMLAVSLLTLLFCGGLWAQRPVWTDSVGARIDWQGAPQRVVSLAPSLTEEVFAVGAGAQLVGDTDYCVHPAAARQKVKIGSIQKPNAEIIVSLHPDLVLATQDGNSAETVEALRRLGMRVFTFGPSRSFDDVRQNFLTLGDLLGRTQQARARMQQADAALQAIHHLVHGQPVQRVFLQLGPGSLYTVNRETYLNDVLQQAHASNVMAALPVRYPEVAREAVIQADPDAILVTLDLSSAMAARAMADWSAFPRLRAVRQRHIFGVDVDLFNSPTPMTFLASVCITVHCLYPQAHVACSEEATP